MVEAKDLGGICRVDVQTAAVGFGAIWQAVMSDFFARHQPADLLISIHDVGATPAVVGLRLDQALEEFREAHS
jgi:malonate decarboxylase delta subunit